MDSVALLPPDIAAFAEPLTRPAAAHRGPLDAAGPAPPGAEAFAQFLALFVPTLASGQELPPSGKPLPLALPETAPAILDSDMPEAPAIAPADPAALSGLAVWLATRGDSGTSAVALPLDPAEGFAGATPEESPLRPALGGVAVPTAAASAAAALLRSPSAEGVATLDAPALPENLAAIELPAASAGEAPVGATSDSEAATFDAMVRGEALTEAIRTRADARAATQTPIALAASPTATAAWLAPVEQAVGQPAVRSADGVGGVTRTTRKGDAYAFASTVTAFTEAVTPTTEGLPPALPTAGATSNPAPAAAPAAFGDTALGHAAVDTRAPQWQEAFAGRVQWLVDQGIGEARMKLNPPELGAVDVKISLVDDKTYVQLTAATAAARDELTQSLPRLRDLFVASGLELGGASVHGGRGGHGGHGGAGSGAGGGYEPAPRYAGHLPAVDLDALSAEAPRLARARAGAIDIFA